MFALTILCITAGAVEALFIVMEIAQARAKFNHLCSNVTGLRAVSLVWRAPACAKGLIADIVLTTGFMLLFGLGGGLIGSTVALVASSVISGYLFFSSKKE